MRTTALLLWFCTKYVLSNSPIPQLIDQVLNSKPATQEDAMLMVQLATLMQQALSSDTHLEKEKSEALLKRLQGLENRWREEFKLEEKKEEGHAFLQPFYVLQTVKEKNELETLGRLTTTCSSPLKLWHIVLTALCTVLAVGIIYPLTQKQQLPQIRLNRTPACRYKEAQGGMYINDAFIHQDFGCKDAMAY